ncbi:unnamed protein product, partial [Mesorhabditis spiculigera]
MTEFDEALQRIHMEISSDARPAQTRKAILDALEPYTHAEGKKKKELTAAMITRATGRAVNRFFYQMMDAKMRQSNFWDKRVKNCEQPRLRPRCGSAKAPAAAPQPTGRACEEGPRKTSKDIVVV